MTDSTDSGQGSAPLSDTYVAVGAEGGPRKKGRSVKAPEGSAQFGVRRSTRVASAKSRHSVAPTPNPSLIKVPPGVRPSVGYQYEVLPTVAEQTGDTPLHRVGPMDLSGKVVGSRDFTVIQAGSKTAPEAKVGRKRSATSEAPGSIVRIHLPPPRASAADFSPTHFDEPQSENLLDAWQGSALQNAKVAPQLDVDATTTGKQPTSPMTVDPRTPTRADKRKGNTITTPVSSPLGGNPLLRRLMQDIYRTRDLNAAWLAAQGLVPPGDGYRPAGYTPPQIVGGITYKVHSPKAHQAGAEGSSSGRKLFAEYLGDTQHMLHASPHDTVARIQPGQHSPQITASACVHIDSGQHSLHIAAVARMRHQPGAPTAKQAPAYTPYASMRTFAQATQPTFCMQPNHESVLQHHSVSQHPQATSPTWVPTAGMLSTHPVVNVDLVAAIAAWAG